VINFFVNRALAGETLTVYEPGTGTELRPREGRGARVRPSAERLLEQLASGETGTETFEIASEEDMSVMEVAEIVREVAHEEREIDVDVELVENPRSAETMVEEFGVDISAAGERLGWAPSESVNESVRHLLTPKSDS